MFTPPNQPSSSTANRRRPLPSRSSLSNSFSFSQTPNRNQPPGWDDSLELEFDTSSVSFAHVRRRLSITEQGNRGIGQVSPRLRPGAGSRRGSNSTSTRTVTAAAAVPQPTRLRSRLGHGHVHVTPDSRKGLGSPSIQAQEMGVELGGEDHVMGEEDGSDEEGEGEEVTWGMIDSMRLWRNDAIMQHLYETAAFWGDKILSWTGELFISRPQGKEANQ